MQLVGGGDFEIGILKLPPPLVPDDRDIERVFWDLLILAGRGDARVDMDKTKTIRIGMTVQAISTWLLP